MKADELTYEVTWSEESRQFEGRCESFPSLVFQAPTEEEAKEGIAKLIASLTSADPFGIR